MKVDHLAPQFNAMMDTYKKLGMDEPEIFYTDNVIADQRFLSEVIPSLVKDVVPIDPSKTSWIEKNDLFALYPKLTLPDSILRPVLNTEDEINNACDTLIQARNEMGEIHVGFDCEWIKTSPISLIQISP
jgi:hypothetical protein